MTDWMDHYRNAATLHQQGRTADAERHYRAALQAQPGHPGVLHGLGVLCVQTNRLKEAAELLRQAAAGAPDEPDIRNHHGLILSRFRRYDEAAAEFEAALRLKDDFVEARLGVADAYLHLGRHTEAAEAFERVLAARPGWIPAQIGLGDALCVLGRPHDAQRVYERILAADANNAVALFGIGTVMTHLGRFAEARTALARAIALAPRAAAFHRALAELERFREGDARLPALEQLAREALADDQKVELHFALGKAYDDLGRYDEAFAQFQSGNTLKRRMVRYDEDAMMRAFRDIAATFTPEVMASDTGNASDLPVFVVGMPRSGTSLIEQILASHPDVHGAGELTVLGALIGGNAPDYPSAVPNDAALHRIGSAYIERIRALAPEAKRIVDKLPTNFLHLGLIHLALPKARIIHVRRDARDTCFSCYAKLFPGGLDFTYDLGELGRYYNAYEALMAHWRAVLPATAMIEVQYEHVVEDLDAEARRMIAFCGLSWDARCLAFHQTDRAVRTHSEVQVRRPLFNTSVGRWRAYESHLQPLIVVLR
jgi:tetratricopeptide (TPR) repeat protein